MNSNESSKTDSPIVSRITSHEKNTLEKGAGLVS